MATHTTICQERAREAVSRSVDDLIASLDSGDDVKNPENNLTRKQEQAAQSARFSSSLYASKDEEERFQVQETKCRLDMYDQHETAEAAACAMLDGELSAVDGQAGGKKKHRNFFKMRFRKQ